MKKESLRFLMMLTRYSVYGFLLQFLLITSMFAMEGEAQVLSMKDVNIDIRLKNARVEKVLRFIERQAEFVFIYSREELRKTATITLNMKNKPVFDVLTEISRQSKLEFKQVNKNISVRMVDKAGWYNPRSERTSIAQEQRVTGRIISAESGEGLPGVNVVIKGTTQGTVTGPNGDYEINVPSSDVVLVFSFVGYANQETTVGTQTVIDIEMSPDVTALSEVIVIGYGTQKKSHMTSAISKVNADALDERTVARLDQALQGKMAGLQIISTTGQPGAAPAVRIRGSSSISAGNEPLYVLDGIPVGSEVMTNVNPGDIASIEVLKDAASAAIYGSRGSNGVILITTKSGTEGKLNLEFNAYYGIQHIERKVDLMGRDEFIQMNIMARNNAWVELGGQATDNNDVRNGVTYDNDPLWLSDPASFPDLDHQDWLFNPAPIMDYTLAASGGNEKANYRISMNYFNQDGISKGNNFDRFSLRANVNLKVNDRIKVGLNLAPSYTRSKAIEVALADGSGKQLAISDALLHPPIIPENWGWYQQPTYGYGFWLELDDTWAKLRGVDDLNTVGSLYSNTYQEVSIIDGLVFRMDEGIHFNTSWHDYYVNPFANSGNPANGQNWGGQSLTWNVDSRLSYSKTFGKHDVSAVVVYSAQKSTGKSSYLQGQNFPHDVTQTLNSALTFTGNTRLSEWSLLSYVSRLSYAFDGKYLFSASYRRDGSSRFGMNNRWGDFPSLSAGWRISEESFFDGARNLFSDMKVRASWGKTGNNNIGNYSSYAGVGQGRIAIGMTENREATLYPNGLSNPDLGWEKTASTNIGVDIGLFNNRVSVSAEYYLKQTEDMLLDVPIPLTTGFGTQKLNYGAVKNTGFEIDLNTVNSDRQLKWNTNVNFSYNKNEVTSLNAPIITGQWYAPFNKTDVGLPMGAYYMLDAIGVWNTPEEISSNPHLPTDKPGDFRYRDANGDGQIDSSDDRVIVGQSMPKYFWGLTNDFAYKGFDFSVFIYGAGGNKIFNTIEYRHLGSVANIGTNSLAGLVERSWKSVQDPGDGKTPMLNALVTGGDGLINSKFLYKGDFIRIKNLTLGYTVPRLREVKIERLRVYCTVENLFTFDDYPLYNPEVNEIGNGGSTVTGGDYGQYPLARTISFGLNVTF